MIERLADLRKKLSEVGGLKMAEYTFGPITIASGLIGCTSPAQISFNAAEYKYRTTILMSDNIYSGSLYLYSNDEPIITQSGNRTVLKIHNATCPTKGFDKNRFDKSTLEEVGCQDGVYDFQMATSNRITVTTKPE